MPISETESAYKPIIYGQQTPIGSGQKEPSITDYDWDMAIKEIQMADDIMLNGDTRIEYIKQKQLLEILHTLLDYIE